MGGIPSVRSAPGAYLRREERGHDQPGAFPEDLARTRKARTIYLRASGGQTAGRWPGSKASHPLTFFGWTEHRSGQRAEDARGVVCRPMADPHLIDS